MAIRGQAPGKHEAAAQPRTAAQARPRGEEYEEVQIGRGTVFGNMLAMRKDGSADRDAVCSGYEELLHDLGHADVHAIGRRRCVNMAMRANGEVMKYMWRE